MIDSQSWVSPQATEDTILSFLAFFNEIDKHFDKILGEEWFSPYNEKLKKIAEGRYSISNFIRKHLYQLKNFGELRNFITHGIKTNGETYAMPTISAVEKISKYAHIIMQPARVIDLFKKPVFTAKKSDFLRTIIPLMKSKSYTNIPIYDDQGKFQGILSESRLLYRIADILSNEDYLNITLLKVEHIPLHNYPRDYLFIPKTMTIYEADELFTRKKLKGEKLLAAFITETGSEEEEILGLISSSDANVIDQYLYIN